MDSKEMMIKKSIVLSVINIEQLKTLKYHTFSIKQLYLLFVISMIVKIKQYLKERNRLRC